MTSAVCIYRSASGYFFPERNFYWSKILKCDAKPCESCINWIWYSYKFTVLIIYLALQLIIEYDNRQLLDRSFFLLLLLLLLLYSATQAQVGLCSCWDIDNITYAACTGWGLQRGLSRDPWMCSLKLSLHIKSKLVWCFCLYIDASGCTFSPLLLQKSCWRCRHLWWGPGNYICFASIFQVQVALEGSRCLWDFFEHYWVLHDNAAFLIF